jgi:hypothetical protein
LRAAKFARSEAVDAKNVHSAARPHRRGKHDASGTDGASRPSATRGNEAAPQGRETRDQQEAREAKELWLSQKAPVESGAVRQRQRRGKALHGKAAQDAKKVTRRGK